MICKSPTFLAPTCCINSDHCQLARPGLQLAAGHIDRDGQDNHRTDDDVLDVIARAEQVEAVANGGDQQGAQQRAPDRAFSAAERCAANDAGGNGVRIIGCGGGGVGRVQPARKHDAGDTAHETGNHVHNGKHILGPDTRQPGRLRISAYAVDLAAKRRVVEENMENDIYNQDKDEAYRKARQQLKAKDVHIKGRFTNP